MPSRNEPPRVAKALPQPKRPRVAPLPDRATRRRILVDTPARLFGA